MSEHAYFVPTTEQADASGAAAAADGHAAREKNKAWLLLGLVTVVSLAIIALAVWWEARPLHP